MDSFKKAFYEETELLRASKQVQSAYPPEIEQEKSTPPTLRLIPIQNPQPKHAYCC